VLNILIESPDRFARDLAGHDHLKRLGVALVPTSAAGSFHRGYCPPRSWFDRFEYDAPHPDYDPAGY
jgi:hypothetical protein